MLTTVWTTLLILGSAAAVLLIVTLIYRSMLQNHEEDQLFLDDAEHSMAQEQLALVARIDALRMPIGVLSALSAVLLGTGAGLWWHSLRTP